MVESQYFIWVLSALQGLIFLVIGIGVKVLSAQLKEIRDKTKEHDDRIREIELKLTQHNEREKHVEEALIEIKVMIEKIQHKFDQYDDNIQNFYRQYGGALEQFKK